MHTLGSQRLSSQTLSNSHQFSGASSINIGVFTVGIQSAQTFSTIATTASYNEQFQNISYELNSMRQHYQKQVNDMISSGSQAKGALRSKGVQLAWKYEQAEVQMGGKGTANWSRQERQSILKVGKVRGAEGHHINSVASSPELQANPDNIQMVENRAEHQKMHGGDFKNPTKGKLIDRNQRLKQANQKRIVKNECAGIGKAAAIGLGMGFALGFIAELAQSGVSIENVKNAAVVGAGLGGESAALGVLNHVIVRGIGDLAQDAIQGVLQNIGIKVTENISRMCNMGVTGGIAIIAFSVYQFCKLKLMGYDTKECLIRVGKSAAFSLTVLTLSIIAQGIWAGAAGIIVSLGIGATLMTYTFVRSRYMQKLIDRLLIYTIQKYEPIYAVG
ncbi:hypothetical protein L2089_15320 [Paenibacillus hunanensis]|uniref:hypothetical protein n=1 Tax=Paenibacillus hunanensis TaxID=539262 RepID=UPI0020260C12|nr:hypothetical protein [Paenibacillus hunanensis]MCL9662063.1 hypothetical protein [Paenibacillus hunanensis]